MIASSNVICGSLALLAAMGLNRNKNQSLQPNKSTSVSLLMDTAPLTLAALGSWWLLKAIGNIKVGISHKLGTPMTIEAGDSDKVTYRRRLGLLERWYVAHSRTGMHTGFTVAIELEPKTGQAAPSLKDIRQILQRVSHSFPWLRVKVKRDGILGIDSRKTLTAVTGTPQQKIWGDDLYVETLGTSQASGKDTNRLFGLREVILPSGEDDNKGLRSILEEEGATAWQDENPNAPMWRAIMVKKQGRASFTLVLSFHHLIVDGIGATAIAQAVVNESNTLTSPENVPSNVSEELSPPMEDVMDTVPTLGHLLTPVLLDQFPSLTRYLKPPHWQGLTKHNKDKSLERKSQMTICSISLDGNGLSQTCQRMNVTVNSLCVANLCKAIANTIGEEEEHASAAMTSDLSNGSNNNSHVRFKVQVAKNERGNCALLPKDLGVYLSGPQVYVTAAATCSTESIASSFQRKLYASFRGSAMDLGLCKFISEDWISFARKFAKHEPNGIHDSLEFSNLGTVRLKDASSDGWNVRGFWFAQGRRETGAAITATIARNEKDGSNIRAVLSSIPQAVPRETLEKISQVWGQEMRNVVGKK